MTGKLRFGFGLLVWFAASSAFAAKTFVYCSEGSPTLFNSQMITDGPSMNATHSTMYNTLVDYKKGTTEIKPSLAESWETSKDGLKITFKLRKGVKFHTTAAFTPTRDFNADDLIYSFERMRDPKHPFHKVNGGQYEYWDSMEMSKIIKEIKKIDDYTVQFQLSQQEAPFITNLAMPFTIVLSKEYLEKMMAAKTPEKVDTQPVGTGPFVFQSYEKDSIIRYKAFDNYFKGRPKIDNLVFSITTDASVRTQKLKAGECHLIAEPSPQDLPKLKQDSNFKVLELEGLNVGYLAMNVNKKPFDKLEVRQAVNMAMNRKSYMEAIYLGNASLAKNPVPPTSWSYNASTPEIEYNPEKAKELLKKAGYPNGFETSMYTLPVSRPYNPSGKKMGEMMQADLAKVGIKVKLMTYDWPTYLDKTRKGEHEMAQLGWTADNGDPDNFLNMLLGCAAVRSGSNISKWCHKPFNDLVQKGKQVMDIKKRTEFYKKAQLVFSEQAPWVTLAHARIFRAISAKVKNYGMSPLGDEIFEDLDLQ
jgi:dipeptide transport system substrate-binding protein